MPRRRPVRRVEGSRCAPGRPVDGNPFARFEADLVAKVERGEMNGDQAMVQAARFRKVCFVRRARELDRELAALDAAIMKLGDERRELYERFDAVLSAAGLYAQHEREFLFRAAAAGRLAREEEARPRALSDEELAF